MSKAINETISYKNDLTVTAARVHDLEEQVQVSEERVAQLQKELEYTRASRATDLSKFLKELKTKENEIIEKEASAYVQANCNTPIFGSAFYCSGDQCLSGQLECLELYLNAIEET